MVYRKKLAGKRPHFDARALIKHVYDQPIGLRVSTNHPHGFRRLLYLESRKRPASRVQILQCPDSATAFLLVRDDVGLEEAAQPDFDLRAAEDSEEE